MKNVSGSNAAETRMIKAVQRAVGAIEDGSIGAQTMSDIARLLNTDCFPLGITIYEQPVIISKDLTPAAVSSPLSAYADSISGSFSYQGKPCSILVSNGKVECGYSCHYWTGGFPESVIYKQKDGTFGIKRVTSTEALGEVEWAIGGLGLLNNYSPAAEGFTGAYADVLRKTNHTFAGVKGKHVYLGYISNMTAEQVNAHAKKLGLEMAIMLDGGHVAAINSECTKINTSQKQYYIVQAIGQASSVSRKIFDIANKEIGITEFPMNSNNVKYNTWYYGKPVSGEKYPWCVVFVQWCYAQAGMALPFKTASCSGMLGWYKRNHPECVTDTPVPGSIIIFDFPKTKYDTDHMGLFVRFEGDKVVTIDGNTGTGNEANGGAVMLRSDRPRSYIKAIITPECLLSA